MTRSGIVEFVLAILAAAALFVLSAALAGLWLGLALRFVWVLAYEELTK